MCIGIPMQVLAIDTELLRADCLVWSDSGDVNEIQQVDVSLVGAVAPGQWLLVFLGAARECLTPGRATQVGQALQALQLVQQGQLDALDGLFADLEREPELPEHLRSSLPTSAGESR